jgi:transmembrane sensor
MHDEKIREEAAAWAVRVADPAFDDWDGFTAWLESDPAHAEAYDHMAASVAEAAETMKAAGEEAPACAPANDDMPEPPTFSRRWLGGAIAASLLVAAFLGLWPGEGGTYTIETAPGSLRTVNLPDGGSIALAGGSRIELDRDNPRFARLDHGRALFTIVHDEADPFVLLAGEDRLVDAGTVFDVKLGDAGLAVSVAEGAVIFNPSAEAARIEPGQLLTASAGASGYVVSEIAPEQVGEWQEGRLTFADASLDEVAADLTSATGLRFTAAPGSGGGISGSLLVDPIKDNPRSLGPLLGVGVRAANGGWVIEAR